ncbi:TNNI1 family protein [Megaselia abdita]
MADDEAKKAKQAEIERKRAEVRKRMEEASKAKKAKKGFMTPERKKKLRLLLRKKAAEELKKEQERKAAERRRIIEERCGSPRNLSSASEGELQEICEEYFERMYLCEGQKWDLEYEVRKKDWEVLQSIKIKLIIIERIILLLLSHTYLLQKCYYKVLRFSFSFLC